MTDDRQPARPGPLHEEQKDLDQAPEGSAEDVLQNTADQARSTSRGPDYPEARSAEELARGAERGTRQEDYGREGS